MAKFFFSIYKQFRANKILGFGILILLFLGLAFVATKITFEEDITKLIPTTQKSEEAQNILKNVNFADKIIVNFKRSEKGTLDELTEAAESFLEAITASSAKFIQDIKGKVAEEDIENTMDFVYANLPLFLDASDYKTITQRLGNDSIAAITQQNYNTLVSPSGLVAKQIILKDPLGLSFIALKKLRQLGFGEDFTVHNGFVVSKDQQNLLLFISPKLAANETDGNAQFIENLKTDIAKTNIDFKGKITTEFFGGTAVAVANAQQIKSDIQLTVGIAITILLLILIFFYRKITVPLILFVPTIFGGLLAVSVLFIVREKISAVSLGIGAVLLGITLDYSLHILTHIRNKGTVKNLYREIAKPILLSSLTTAMAFLCLLFLKSQALQDLGIFAAISVLGASVFALVLIPLVYQNSKGNTKQKSLLDNFAAYGFHSKKWLIIILFLLLIGSFFTYNKVVFNKDLSQLNYEPQELVNARNRLDRLTNIQSKSVYIAAYGTSIETAFTANDAVHSKLIQLQRNGSLIEFSSIGSLLNSTKNQEQKIAAWKLFWNDEKKQDITNKLIGNGNKLGFKPDAFQQFYTHLNTDFKTLTPEGFNKLQLVSLSDYVNTSFDLTTITSLAKVKNGKMDTVLKTFNNSKNTLVIDRKQMNETFLGNLKTDFNRLVLYSFVIVCLILLLYYKSFSLSLVTIAPIAFTWLLTIGIMGLFGVEFNIFNIIISTFIFGLGIDYAIFITNGLLHELKTGEKVLPTHKTSILLSVITTILGVGVLVFAKHPALYSISLVSIIGIVSALLISFTIQPLLFTFFIGSKKQRPHTFRYFIHSVISFTYYGLGGLFLSMLGMTILPLIPISKKKKMEWFHRTMSKFMGSVLFSNPFVHPKLINEHKEDFNKQGIIIANHSSFLDILVIGMLHPKIIFMVNDWVYNSPFFGKAVQLAGFYPASSGIEKGVSHLQEKIRQGYTLMVFPEGTRSTTNRIKRFHKGAFYLSEQLQLDLIPILIHGNSEALPKGSFLIKRRNLTLKILERIPYNTTEFGKSYKDKGKLVGAFFRKEFKKLREELEGPDYFHSIVLEDYRYKGDTFYKSIKTDLKTYALAYRSILGLVDEKANVLHFSKDAGQLDFLLSLDGPSRKMYSCFQNNTSRIIIENSFIYNDYGRISCFDNVNEIKQFSFDIAIINTEEREEKIADFLNKNEIETIALLKDSIGFYRDIFKNNGYKTIESKTHFVLLKK